MKKYIQLTLIALLGLAPNLVLAENDYYISPQVGVAMPNKKVRFELEDRSYDEPEVTKKRFKNAATYGVTFGKKVQENTFVELEVTTTSNHKFNENAALDMGENVDPIPGVFKPKLKSASVFVNASYQFRDKMQIVVPYVLAGVGYSKNKISPIAMSSRQGSPAAIPGLVVPSKTTSNFAWQVGAGILVPVTNNLEINLGYKFRNLGKVRSSATYNIDGIPSVSTTPLIKGKLYSSDILVGISYKF